MNRRAFIQSVAALTGAIAVLPTLASAQERRRGSQAAAGATLVDPKDPAAKAVNYVHVTSEIKDAALKVERAGVKFEAQNCKNCAFYTADKETTVSGKKAAPCQMPFAAGKVVAATGWCSTWAKKS